MMEDVFREMGSTMLKLDLCEVAVVHASAATRARHLVEQAVS